MTYPKATVLLMCLLLFYACGTDEELDELFISKQEESTSNALGLSNYSIPTTPTVEEILDASSIEFTNYILRDPDIRLELNSLVKDHGSILSYRILFYNEKLKEIIKSIERRTVGDSGDIEIEPLNSDVPGIINPDMVCYEIEVSQQFILGDTYSFTSVVHPLDNSNQNTGKRYAVESNKISVSSVLTDSNYANNNSSILIVRPKRTLRNCMFEDYPEIDFRLFPKTK